MSLSADARCLCVCCVDVYVALGCLKFQQCGRQGGAQTSVGENLCLDDTGKYCMSLAVDDSDHTTSDSELVLVLLSYCLVFYDAATTHFDRGGKNISIASSV